MKCLSVVVVIAVVFGVRGLARADAPSPADKQKRARTLHQEGTILAKAGHYDGAIAKYKQAQALVETWQRWCNIGTGYVHLRIWHRAEWFLRRCRHKAGAEFPSYRVATMRRLERTLRRGKYARLLLDVRPPDAAVRVSAYAGDESLSSGQPFWVPLGSVSITVRKPASVTKVVPLTLAKRGAMVKVSVVLMPTPVLRKQPEPKPIPVVKVKVKPKTDDKPNTDGSVSSGPTRIENRPLPPATAHDTTRRRPAGTLTWVSLAAGALALGGGGVFHAVALGTQSDAEALPPRPADEPYPEYDAKLRTFQKQRMAAVGLYAVGALATGYAIYRLLTRGRTPPRGASAGAMPVRGGVAMVARWSW